MDFEAWKAETIKLLEYPRAATLVRTKVWRDAYVGGKTPAEAATLIDRTYFNGLTGPERSLLIRKKNSRA
jgi:hypothetical protein